MAASDEPVLDPPFFVPVAAGLPSLLELGLLQAVARSAAAYARASVADRKFTARWYASREGSTMSVATIDIPDDIHSFVLAVRASLELRLS